MSGNNLQGHYICNYYSRC